MEAYYDWLNHFDGRPTQAWMENHLELPVAVTVVYLALVLWVPDNYMKQRPAYNLQVLNILWNALLAVFSIVGASYTLPLIYRSISGPYESVCTDGQCVKYHDGRLYESVCHWKPNLLYHGPTGAFVLLFILSKIPEMIDTAFLVFQKKRLIFLHWYHHVTVMLYCWHAYVNLIGSGLIYAGMNYGVHSIMYTYFFICACGYRRTVRPIAPLITSLQILQMVLGTATQLFSLYHAKYSGRGCEHAQLTNIHLGLGVYVSYFFFFSKLFYDNYLCRRCPTPSEPRITQRDHRDKKCD